MVILKYFFPSWKKWKLSKIHLINPDRSLVIGMNHFRLGFNYNLDFPSPTKTAFLSSLWKSLTMFSLYELILDSVLCIFWLKISSRNCLESLNINWKALVYKRTWEVNSSLDYIYRLQGFLVIVKLWSFWVKCQPGSTKLCRIWCFSNIFDKEVEGIKVVHCCFTVMKKRKATRLWE